VLTSGFVALFFRAEKEKNIWKSLGKIRGEIETWERIIIFITIEDIWAPRLGRPPFIIIQNLKFYKLPCSNNT
jgi:hypothetical protein